MPRTSHGYLVVTDPHAPLRERDTLACRHCQRVIEVKPGTAATVYLIPDARGAYHEESGAFCRNCMGPVCLPCDVDGRCLPFERRLEQMEARDRLVRAAGLA